MTEINKIADFVWEIPKEGDMRVPVKLYASKTQIIDMKEEEKTDWSSIKQLKNVATLPGIEQNVIALSDVHVGYGAPIGGVSAFDLETGVIVFGNIGFDINCISGESKVLHEHGYTKNIKDFETDWFDESIKCLNPTNKVKNTNIDAFLKFKTKKKVYKLETESGRKIIATEDHPFYTSKGMKELSLLKNNEKISVFPFEGVGYEEPSDKIIIAEKDIKNLGFKKNMKQTIDELKKRKLLPLKMNNPKMPYLLKIFGYALGDGNLTIRKNETVQLSFYGNPEDLETIITDVGNIGFKASKIYSRERKHAIQTSYELVKFEHTETWSKCSSKALSALLMAMGLPDGNKVKKNYSIPKWLFKCPLWQKRLFLASLFGAELSTPSTITNHGYNFNNQLLSMNKNEKFVKNGRKFLSQISDLLGDFGIKSSQIKERDEYTNKKGELSIRLRLQIFSRPANLIKLWSIIGFEYNKKRSYLANVATQYLKIKSKIIKSRKKCEQEAKELRKKKLSAKKIYEKLKSKYNFINFRFIERSVYGTRKGMPRISSAFSSFDEFLAQNTKGLGFTGQVWDTIISKEKIDFNKPVYDFTVCDENHNFIANNFVVSNCGVRTLKTDLKREDVEKVKDKLADALFQNIPAGLGVKGDVELTLAEIDDVIVNGAEFAVAKGYGTKEDLEFCEENGKITGAEPSAVSMKAKQRQFKQVGTLGSGNHYLEVQYVDEIYNEKIAKAFGLSKDQIIISIHCGSRALGHQIGSDYLQFLDKAAKKHGIKIKDKELVCAPIQSEEGKQYFSAVKAGINVAFANRHVIGHLTRKTFAEVFGISESTIKTFYDVGHNTAKVEEHDVDGMKKKLLVHRKGSTRGFGPGRIEVPEAYRSVGQPVLVGGTMGTHSYILAGTEKGMHETFGSTVHGAGRVMSRMKAKKQWAGESVLQDLKEKGILVKSHSTQGLAEEAPDAYKDVTEVVDIMHNAGVTEKVVKLKPLIVIKG
ncbi:MAG: RtcB family protein [Candidatus Diapherotrites archaeon]